ncbi:MAG: MarR family transcriptional regulator [Micrococcales bacterium]|uniref:MarR family winged helix-turn-helix transcriptional regulator n=1 Tax=Phycicoccus sp. TaxID=1902410 RepID=UPI0019C34A44|nr:MarR family transcriptional regulator [Phycicoccus sp.]MBD3782145.1 MarR family transcriptional regulator [Micrococcales bacterium]HMM94800.1 MarR family transcriptional regulator [Phycicoccus sp.]
MSDIRPEDLDLTVLAAIAGAAAGDAVLAGLHDAGYPGVRAGHGYVVQVLLRDSPTVGELALELGVSQQAVSKTVGELERLGHVTRRPAPEDARVRRIELTDRGRGLVEETRARRAALVDRVRAAVGSEPLEAASRALVALLDAAGAREQVVARRVRPPG